MEVGGIEFEGRRVILLVSLKTWMHLDSNSGGRPGVKMQHNFPVHLSHRECNSQHHDERTARRRDPLVGALDIMKGGCISLHCAEDEDMCMLKLAVTPRTNESKG